MPFIVTATSIDGAFLIDAQPVDDERGFFARMWDGRELAEAGLDPSLVQCNLSGNRLSRTLRGMHYQVEPHAEVKIVRCTRGSLLDVIVDLRPGSTTYRRWFAAELNDVNRRMLYIPKGLAHGYLTLQDNVEAYYHVSARYSPADARGVRWNDPAIGIKWPFEPAVISDRDREWPLLER